MNMIDLLAWGRRLLLGPSHQQQPPSLEDVSRLELEPRRIGLKVAGGPD